MAKGNVASAYSTLRKVVLPSLSIPMKGYKEAIDYTIVGQMAECILGDPIASVAGSDSIDISVNKKDRKKAISRLEAKFKKIGVTTKRNTERANRTFIIPENTKYKIVGVWDRKEAEEKVFIKVEIS